jgi:2-C-methyl-D-erythritol 4-phosphate cytidylyltransferase
MSGGIGARFGADCPKQYCIMDNRMVIDYVIDACRKTKGVDEIVIVASEQYVDFVNKRYNLPACIGGSSRPESVANGLKFINDNYNCDKLIITNAVCPLATSEQYEKYFSFLDEYDYVLTTWKLAPALHRFDGQKCDRDEFFNVMEPDAYRFKKLYANFDFQNMKKYIFHNMPNDSKAYFCMDYPYTMKLTNPHDLKLLKVLYEDIVIKPKENETLHTVNKYLSADGAKGIDQWIYNVQSSIDEFTNRYQLTSYSINTQTEANIVYEAHSIKYGDIIIKFTPSDFHYHKELKYYQLANKETMAELIGYHSEYNALVIKMIKPGFQVKFDSSNKELRTFYDKIDSNLIPLEKLNNDKTVPTVEGEFEEYVNAAGKYTYDIEFRQSMEKKARLVWNLYFKDSPRFYIHRDLHKRNLLNAGDSIVAIDPRGTIGPRAFEYVIQFIIELRDYPSAPKMDLYNEMFDYFTKYVDADTLKAALFVFWVYKMDDYIFQKNDNFQYANWCKQCILNLYFDGIKNPEDNNVLPQGLKKIK